LAEEHGIYFDEGEKEREKLNKTNQTKTKTKQNQKKKEHSVQKGLTENYFCPFIIRIPVLKKFSC